MEMERRVAGGLVKFTSGLSDMRIVVDLYRSGFVAAFDTFPAMSLGHNIISFFGLGFGEEQQQADHLAEALAFAADQCSFPHGPVRFSAEGNGFSPSSKALLRNAVAGCASIEQIYL